MNQNANDSSEGPRRPLGELVAGSARLPGPLTLSSRSKNKRT